MSEIGDCVVCDREIRPLDYVCAIEVVVSQGQALLGAVDHGHHKMPELAHTACSKQGVERFLRENPEGYSDPLKWARETRPVWTGEWRAGNERATVPASLAADARSARLAQRRENRR